MKISLLIIVFFSFFSSTNDLNCNDLKTGVFQLNSVDGSTHTITRYKNYQTENVGKTGLISQFELKWVSDCAYILYNRKVIKGIDENKWEFENDTLYNEIVEINGNEHKVISSIKKYGLEISALLKKVK